MTWAFILLLHAATFGGDFRVEFHLETEEGCRRLQKVVVREAEGMRLRFTLVECHAESPRN